MDRLAGYIGKILRVDLTKETFRGLELDKDYLTNFIGGAGYAARTLYDMVDPEADPLSPENPLFFIAGPMVGSRFPGTLVDHGPELRDVK